MPDFNKGDFTQQGVAGHVNANLRLNEKRLVNIDMTSNEEAEGCTIAGAVKDLLNDKVYPIGAGVSGNIEITENGENINVAPYATATVNVAGGGDTPLRLCQVTLLYNGISGIVPPLNCVYYEAPFATQDGPVVNPGEPKVVNIAYQYMEGEIEGYFYYISFVDNAIEDGWVMSNPVNCEIITSEYYGTALVPIDLSADSSCTFTLTVDN